jgi:hypothetical protein
MTGISSKKQPKLGKGNEIGSGSEMHTEEDVIGHYGGILRHKYYFHFLRSQKMLKWSQFFEHKLKIRIFFNP